MLRLFVVVLLLLGAVRPKKTQCECHARGCHCVGVGIDVAALHIRTDYFDYNFTGNRINKLAPDSFKVLTKVQFLVLERNEIKSLSSRTFASNNHLVRLDLSENLLTSLPSSLFGNNLNLREIYLENNNLTSIDSRVFHGLRSLTDLRLHNNQIQTIDPNAFITNRKLTELYLETNQLETAHWRWISHFNHSGGFELYLDGNPWSCDCRMKYFYTNVTSRKWLNSTSRSSRINLPKCTNLPGHPLITGLNKNQLKCHHPKITSYINCSNDCRVTFDEGSSGVVVCSGKGKPLPQVFIRNEFGKNITTVRRGKVNVTFDPVLREEAGGYYCFVQGYNSKGVMVTLNKTIDVIIRPTPSSALGVILAILAIIILVSAVAVCHCRKMKARAGYGSLSNGSATDYQLDDVQSTSLPSDVTHLQDNDDEQDDYIRDDQVKYDEKEVLV